MYYKAIALAIMALGLSGCAAFGEKGSRTPFSDGWRRGEVLELGTAQELRRTSYRDCRNEGTPPSPETRYAYVQYLWNSQPQWIVAPMAVGADFKPGDFVYVKVGDCTATIAPDAP